MVGPAPDTTGNVTAMSACTRCNSGGGGKATPQDYQNPQGQGNGVGEPLARSGDVGNSSGCTACNAPVDPSNCGG